MWSLSAVRSSKRKTRLSAFNRQHHFAAVPQGAHDHQQRGLGILKARFWSYPVSVESVGLGDWLSDSPILLSLVASGSSPIFSAASGGGVDAFSGPWSRHGAPGCAAYARS